MRSADYNALSNTAYLNSLRYCYEQLVECVSQLEQMMVNVEGLQKIINSRSQAKLFDFYKDIAAAGPSNMMKYIILLCRYLR
jgi:hypothetical protein